MILAHTYGSLPLIAYRSPFDSAIFLYDFPAPPEFDTPVTLKISQLLP